MVLALQPLRCAANVAAANVAAANVAAPPPVLTLPPASLFLLRCAILSLRLSPIAEISVPAAPFRRLSPAPLFTAQRRRRANVAAVVKGRVDCLHLQDVDCLITAAAPTWI